MIYITLEKKALDILSRFLYICRVTLSFHEKVTKETDIEEYLFRFWIDAGPGGLFFGTIHSSDPSRDRLLLLPG
jgi:hypothetical protein